MKIYDENFSYAKLSDVNEIYKIEKQSFASPWEKQLFIDEIGKDNSHTILLKNKNEIIGFVIFWIVIDEIHIIDLAVKKKYRRQGIAKSLVNRVEEICKEKCLYMWLEVRQSNEAALSFYKSINFEHILTRKNYYGNEEDALILRKEIYKSKVV